MSCSISFNGYTIQCVTHGKSSDVASYSLTDKMNGFNLTCPDDNNTKKYAYIERHATTNNLHSFVINGHYNNATSLTLG